MAEPYSLVDDDELLLYLAVLDMLERQYGAIVDNPQVVLQTTFWANQAVRSTAEITPILAQFMANGANISLADAELAFVESVPELFENVRFAAKEYGVKLIKQIDEYTQEQVVELLDRAIAEGWTTPELTEALTQFPNSPFSEVRARKIAVSETTDAYIKGAEIAGEELKNQGYQVTHIWQTVRDGAVCEICEPRHGMPQGSNWTSMEKAHVGCRCFVTTEVTKI